TMTSGAPRSDATSSLSSRAAELASSRSVAGTMSASERSVRSAWPSQRMVIGEGGLCPTEPQGPQNRSSRRRRRFWGSTNGVDAGREPADDELLYLGGAFVEAIHPRVAPVPLHRELVREAVAAVDLDGVVGGTL